MMRNPNESRPTAVGLLLPVAALLLLLQSHNRTKTAEPDTGLWAEILASAVVVTLAAL